MADITAAFTGDGCLGVVGLEFRVYGVGLGFRVSRFISFLYNDSSDIATADVVSACIGDGCSGVKCLGFRVLFPSHTVTQVHPLLSLKKA